VSTLPKNSYAPLVAHIIQRLAVGGLENGVVNLINHMPEDRYRHIIVCLAHSTDYARRLKTQNVPVMALHQRPGQDFSVHWRLLKLFIRLRPDIVHTRNLSGLEFQAIAALAGVRGRVHGEHGRDIHDLDGRNLKYKVLRKTIRPLVHQYTAVSIDLAHWLVDTISIRPDRVTQIYNGVDIDKFRVGKRQGVGPPGFLATNSFVVGTVGRMQPVKNQLILVRAFLHLIQTDPEVRKRLRLVMIGDGPLRNASLEILRAAGAEALAWVPGERADIPELMRAFDLFVLPSLREGISNTILEAMASGLPVIATCVGGNPELVIDGQTGLLVPAGSPVAVADAIKAYLQNPSKLIEHGMAGRKRVEKHFSIDSMITGYMGLYDEVFKRSIS
jgi:sugar transferase (PEP-CTERM/EpsH1 system associated)